MSEKIEVEVFYRSSSAWVFQRTDRSYPSISIQGDSLSLLLSRAESIVNHLEAGQWDEEVAYDLEYVRDVLSNLWDIYQKHGLRNQASNTQDQTAKE